MSVKLSDYIEEVCYDSDGELVAITWRDAPSKHMDRTLTQTLVLPPDYVPENKRLVFIANPN